jgi:peptide/nickel transport system substrate-binding protein
MVGGDTDTLDPAFAYRTDITGLLSLTGDGLTAMRRVGGPDGMTIVPDLARSLPNPVDGGKTYAFRLRKGVRFSTGALVTPAVVRSSFERLFEAGSPGAAYFGHIVGAAGCTKGRRCNLSRGIVTDAAAGTVTFHLTSPDRDFLYKLALSFAFVLPANAPKRDAGHDPLPATGPYVIRRYRPEHSLELVRNPYFRPLSPAAHTAGYPDEIVVKLGLKHPLEAVEQGRLDYTQVAPAQLRQVGIRYAGRFHLNILSATDALFLDTTIAPCNRVAVRRAIALAVDRREVVSLYGGPLASRPTCQILPPSARTHGRCRRRHEAPAEILRGFDSRRLHFRCGLHNLAVALSCP